MASASSSSKDHSSSIDLAKAEIARDFGASGVERFNHHFQIKRALGQLVTPGEIDEFKASEREKSPNSYFLSSSSTLEELKAVSEDQAQKVIKSSGSISHTDSPSLTAPTEEEEQQEGVHMARELVKTSFEDLKPFHRQAIEETFKKTFTDAGKTPYRAVMDPTWEKKPLTIEAFNSFIETEREKSKGNTWYYDLVSNPYLCAGSWNILTTAAMMVRIYYFPHNLAVATMIIVVIHTPSDLLSKYRQLPMQAVPVPVAPARAN